MDVVIKNHPRRIGFDVPGEFIALIAGSHMAPFLFCPLSPVNVSPYWAACFLRRLRQSAIMAMNSLLVGLPLMLETV